MFEALRAEGRLGLFPYLTVGYPRPEDTVPMVEAVLGAGAGVDRLIVADLSMEETGELHRSCRAAGMDLVFFIAPTSTEARMRTVARLASGFIYCVSVTGVTGSRESLGDDVDEMLARIRK